MKDVRMTNISDEFAQQLEELFRYLDDVLKRNLADKASTQQLKALETELKQTIQNMNIAMSEHIKKLERRVTDNEEKTKRLEQAISSLRQQGQPSTPALTESIPHQPVKHAQPAPSKTEQPKSEQSNNNLPEITINKGDHIGGRPNKEKMFIRTAFAVIETPELAHQITQSEAYQTSAQGADKLLQNALPLLNGDNAVIHALETCILIDLLNVTFIDILKDVIDPYSKYIKTPNTKTIKPLEQGVFKYYGFNTDMLNDNLSVAIENIAQMETMTLQQRQHGVAHSRFPSTLEKFMLQMKQDINNRNAGNPKSVSQQQPITTTPPAVDSAPDTDAR
jgi:hypothetical protein